MAGTGGRRHKIRSAEANRSTVVARDELKRTLERDTAVQGERTEEAVAATRAPAGADSAPPKARPAPAGRTKKTS